MPVHIQTGVGDLRTPRAPQMTPDQMRGLAARLRARAKSVLLRNQPEQHRDLLTAATLIEQLASLTAEVLASAAVIDGLTRLLDIVGGA
jgi:hypothetical protein